MRVGLAAAIAAVFVAGCFTPKLDPCALQCAAGNECPRGTQCLADGFCHDSTGEDLCAADDIDAGGGIDADTTPDANLPDAMVCLTACGDGVVDDGMGEACDDGNCDPGDGCSDVCAVEANFICLDDEPTTCNREPTLAGDAIITEIFRDPIGGDGVREWFEVHNPGTVGVDLLGVSFADDNADAFAITVNLPIPPGGHAVIGASTDMGQNDGVTVDFAWSNFQLGNNNDEILMKAASSGVQLDDVRWNNAQFPDTEGDSMSLDPDNYSATLNDIGGSWCDGAASFGTGGGAGTPGALNQQCP